MNALKQKFLYLCLGTVAVGMAYFILGLGYYLPIFPDEIAYRLLHSRWITDRHTIGTLFPMCLSDQGKSIPISWIPRFYIDSLTLGQVDNFQTLRWFGLGMALITIASFTAFAASIFPQDRAKAALLAFFSVFIGVLPWMLILTRYESLILCTMVLLLMVQRASHRFVLLRSLLFLFLFSCFISFHPKAMVFAPIFIYLAATFGTEGRKGRLATIFLTLATVVIFLESLQYYTDAVKCVEEPSVQGIQVNHALQFGDFFANPSNFYLELKESLRRTYLYVVNSGFSSGPPLNWTVPMKGDNRFYEELIALVFLLVLVATAALSLGLLLHWKTLSWSRLEAFLFFGAWAGYIAINKIKNFYDAVLVAVILMITFFEVIRLLPPKLQRVFLTYFLVIFTVASIIAETRLYHLTKDTLPAQFQTAGIQHHLLGSEKLEQAFHVTEKRCKIKNISKLRHVIVDDMTYLAMKNARHPALITYMQWGYQSESNPNDKFFELMQTYQPDAFFYRCYHGAPPPFDQHLTQGKGHLCCIGKKEIQAILQQRK